MLSVPRSTTLNTSPVLRCRCHRKERLYMYVCDTHIHMHANKQIYTIHYEFSLHNKALVNSFITGIYSVMLHYILTWCTNLKGTK